jgi:hypothetical protein
VNIRYVASFRFVFTETNTHAESLRHVAAGYRNQILWDGAPLMTSTPMAALDVGATRRVRWPGGAWLPRDALEHNLTLVLNSPVYDGTLNLTENEGVEPWTRSREAYYDNNAYTVMVSFCERKPDLTLGELASVGQASLITSSRREERRGNRVTFVSEGVYDLCERLFFSARSHQTTRAAL